MLIDPRSGILIIMRVLARKYGKALVSVAAGVVTTVIAAKTGDGHIEPSEGVAIVGAVAQLALVYLVPLNPERRWTKSLAGAVAAAATVGATVVVDGWPDLNGWWLIMVAVGSALGIKLATAVTPSDRFGSIAAKAGLHD